MKKLSVGFWAIFLLLSCQQERDSGSPLHTVLTDQAAMLPLIDSFNEASGLSLVVVYAEDIAKKADIEPDLVVTNRPGVLVRKFGPAGLSTGRLPLLTKKTFYKDFLHLSYKRSLVPLSFLPALILEPARKKENSLLPVQKMLTEAAAFGEKKEGVPIRIGFSLYWNKEMIPLLPALFSDSGKPFSASDFLSRLQSYRKESGLSDEEMIQFQKKYLYLFPPALITEKRILFLFQNSLDFLTFPAVRKKELQLSFLQGEGGKIPVTEAVFLGMMKNKSSRRIGYDFLQWFFQKKTQEKLLEQSRVFGDPGILGGFSLRDDVNRDFYAREFPGQIFPKRSLWDFRSFSFRTRPLRLSDQILLWLRSERKDLKEKILRALSLGKV